LNNFPREYSLYENLLHVLVILNSGAQIAFPAFRGTLKFVVDAPLVYPVSNCTNSKRSYGKAERTYGEVVQCGKQLSKTNGSRNKEYTLDP
jgi:hypothetical protein